MAEFGTVFTAVTLLIREVQAYIMYIDILFRSDSAASAEEGKQ